MQPTHKLTYQKGITWATRLVKESLYVLCHLWQSRNKMIHTPVNDETNSTFIDQRVRQRVEEVFADKTTYHLMVQENLFHIPKDQRLEQSTFNLVKWLETIDKAQNTWLQGGQDSIYQYVHPTRPPDLSQSVPDTHQYTNDDHIDGIYQYFHPTRAPEPTQ